MIFLYFKSFPREVYVQWRTESWNSANSLFWGKRNKELWLLDGHNGPLWKLWNIHIKKLRSALECIYAKFIYLETSSVLRLEPVPPVRPSS